ncbi:Glutathione S-transferase [Macleaya cordata]|uniref:Glutathione S-transferase n=1 Tax=Macleaya cordata TaxID=56857 RepID=A0A200QF27_MACCD|nr:Glutathione S-transferase [Macleaya cordata]
MGEVVSEIKLYGKWSSSYCMRVELALKLKGIPYESIEEDLKNKSDSLLKYNPVHKKVPVLLHNGRPIAESLVILEYIDETWTNAPLLLPKDPYEQAKVRFWANFYDQKFLPSTAPLMKLKGEEQEKAIEELLKIMNLLEEGLSKDFAGKTPYLNDETPGYLDIAISMSACTYRAFEAVIGTQLIDPQRHPKFLSLVNALKDHPLVKETLPQHDKLVAVIQMFRDEALKSSPN